MKKSGLIKGAAAAAAAVMLFSAVPFANAAEETLPESYSSVDYGYVTSVKTQSGEVCWIHSSLGAFESKLLREGYEIEEMSPDHLNDWATTRANGKGWIRGRSNAGYSPIALGYFASWQGGVFGSEYTTPGDGVTGDSVPADLARFGMTAAEYLSGADRDTVKRAIYENGGIYGCYAHNAGYMNSDHTAYYMPESFKGSATGHAVEIVGWDDGYSASNFKRTPPGDGAWLIKNSWGDTGVMGGYFWLSYYDKFFLDELYHPSYAITEVMKLDSSIKLIQDEIYGATYEFDDEYIDSRSLTFINRFGFDDDFGVVDKIVFETTSLGADYTLYFVPDGEGGEPNSDKASWSLLGSGTTDYSGYICADITDFTLPSTSGSIAVEMTAAEGGNASIGIGEWLTNGTDDEGNRKYVFINESERGQSYVISNGEMTELMDWYAGTGDELGATFVIKAVTQKPYKRGDVNLDGRVDVTDATLVQMYSAKMREINYTQQKAADANRDGKTDISDATVIQMLAAKMDV